MKKPAIDIHLEQQERLTNIGEYLQQVRLAKGWSLTATAKKTQIRATVLEYIEAGELEKLPEPIYLKGLLRRYANCLDLDGEAIAARFPLDDQHHFWKLAKWQNFALRFQLLPVHLYIIYILVVSLTVQTLSEVIRINNTPVITVESDIPTETVSTPKDSIQSAVAKSSTAAIQNNPAPVEDPEAVVVNVQVQDNAWMRVIIDGKTEFEGTLPKGTQKKWVADKSVTIRAGNAGAVLIAINNQTAQPLGKPGAVEEITYEASAEKAKPTRSPS